MKCRAVLTQKFREVQFKRLSAPCFIYDACKIYAHAHIKITRYWTEFNPLESGKGGGISWETITTSRRRGRYIGKREREKEETPLPIFHMCIFHPGDIFARHVGITRRHFAGKYQTNMRLFSTFDQPIPGPCHGLFPPLPFSKGAFLWDDLDQDQRSEITWIMVDQMN